MRRVFANLILAAVLAGCATTPEAPPSALPQDGRGRIVLRPYYVPQGSGNNAVAVFLGGGTSPVLMALYDVTDEQPVALGMLRSQGARTPGWQQTFEYDVPPGPRVLMLSVRKRGGDPFVDFVEVQVGANEVQHVALSQYGMGDQPYFARVPLSQESSRYCLQAGTMHRTDALAAMRSYHRAAEDAQPGYCGALAMSGLYRKVPATGAWEGPLSREQVIALKERYLGKWRAMSNRMPPYDLRE